MNFFQFLIKKVLLKNIDETFCNKSYLYVQVFFKRWDDDYSAGYHDWFQPRILLKAFKIRILFCRMGLV